MDACGFIWLVRVCLFAFIRLYVVVIWYLCIDCLAVLFNALVWVNCGVGFRWNLLFVGLNWWCLSLDVICVLVVERLLV